MIHIPLGLRIDPSWVRVTRYARRHQAAGLCPSCFEHKEEKVHRICARCHADEKRRGSALKKHTAVQLSERWAAAERENAIRLINRLKAEV